MPVAFSPSIKSYFHQSDSRTTLVGARADPGRLSSAGIALLDPWQPGPPCRLQVAVRALQVSYLLIKHHGTMRAVCAPTAYSLWRLHIQITFRKVAFQASRNPTQRLAFACSPASAPGAAPVCRGGRKPPMANAPLPRAAGRCFGFCARAMPHAVLHSGEWPSFPPAPPSRVSPAFSLLPEMRQHKYELSAPLRVQLQLRRWRRDPIFGIIENKLLQATLLSSIANARQARVVYGAFATKAMGTWPIWSRTSLERALEGMRHFVLKSATNGGGADVLIMTEERWHREGWRVENVSRYAGRWMERGAPRSPYPKALHTSRLTHASRVCGAARLAEWRQQQVVFGMGPAVRTPWRDRSGEPLADPQPAIRCFSAAQQAGNPTTAGQTEFRAQGECCIRPARVGRAVRIAQGRVCPFGHFLLWTGPHLVHWATLRWRSRGLRCLLQAGRRYAADDRAKVE